MTPMLFCHIAWMETYTGDPVDNPRGGGSDQEKRMEMYNFKPFGRQVLGFVPARGRGDRRTIDITKLGAAAGAPSYEGVDVVWTATRPGKKGGRFVVGWYRDAIVFRDIQRHADRENYHFKAEKADCVLFEPAYRDIKIETQGSGHPCQTPVWFAESDYGQKLQKTLNKLLNQEFDRDQLNTKVGKLVGKIDGPPKGLEKPSRKMRTVVEFGRNPEVKAYVLQRAKKHCELCGTPAPFQHYKGYPFLEVHHVKRLADGGPDVPRNAVALCPNCHREAHEGINRDEISKKLKRVASRS